VGLLLSKNRKHGVYAVEEIQPRVIKGNKGWTPMSYEMEVVLNKSR